MLVVSARFCVHISFFGAYLDEDFTVLLYADSLVLEAKYLEYRKTFVAVLLSVTQDRHDRYQWCAQESAETFIFNFTNSN